MEVKLENIYLNERLSRKSLAFVATLYINGHLAGILKNDGNGGETTYEAIDSRGAMLIKEAVKNIGVFRKGEGFEERHVHHDDRVEYLLEDIVTELRHGQDAAKFIQRARIEMENGILFGLPRRRYRVLRYAKRLNTIIRGKNGVSQIREDIHTEILPLLKEGERILNTNLPLAIVKMFNVPAKKWVRLRGDE